MNLEKCKNLNEVLNTSGLNFQVEQKPLLFKDGHKEIKIPNKLVNVRVDTQEPLGVVSTNYQLFQNADAFEFVNYIDDNLTYHKAGITGNGMIYIIAEMNETQILGDKYKNFVIFRNSFNLKYPLQATITPMRVVCENQFNKIFSNNENQVRIIHNSSLDSKIQQGKRVLMNYYESIKICRSSIERYAQMKFTRNQFDQFLNYLYPITNEMHDVVQEQQRNRQVKFINAYNRDDNQNFINTFYGVLNATTYIDSHFENTNFESILIKTLDKPTSTSKLLKYVECNIV